ncbi:epimerase [Pseudomonas sp. RGM 3321]|uniref:epimerase n=1 Tax=Pseudomonas sp. RGM 3321 TaxID=2930089 RepID=UPI001FCC603B|nr:epimerase [Pseudomonas sp. RGM 3321]MCJ2374442.1 epimerase [Pseudomonas sp. RGM 3321]
MKVLVFGASGMLGHGITRECLLASDVSQITLVGRTRVDQQDAKLTQVLVPDLKLIADHAAELTGFDACFFCLGASSSGMTEDQYTRITYDLTLAVARLMAAINPSMVFVYVSGASTDSTEASGAMWARVKGRTENDLLKLPFGGVYLFRPAFIQPLHGAQSKTASYRRLYQFTRPFMPLIKRLLPKYFLTTEEVAGAMLNAARIGSGRRVLEVGDIRRLLEYRPIESS